VPSQPAGGAPAGIGAAGSEPRALRRALIPSSAAMVSGAGACPAAFAVGEVGRELVHLRGDGVGLGVEVFGELFEGHVRRLLQFEDAVDLAL
jgi:hypothetical protein